MYNNFAIYSVLSFLLLLLTSFTSYKLNLLDIPSKRKIHTRPTAYTGGFAISIIFLFSLQIFETIDYDLNLIISISFLMTIIGLIDDKYQLNTGSKLCLQVIPIFYLIFIKNISLSQIGDYGLIKLNLSSFGETFTLLCVLFLINSFNYFDGLDGSLSFSVISVLTILFFIMPDVKLKLFITILLIPIIFFLLFNFSLFKLPKLFLGDSGSLLLGFIISFLIIYCANKDIVHPILLAWSISIFVYEFLYTNLARLINKKNPFKAGLDHLHYELYLKTNSIFFTNLIIFNINIIFFIIGFASFKYINPISSLVSFILFFIIFFCLRIYYLNEGKRKKH